MGELDPGLPRPQPLGAHLGAVGPRQPQVRAVEGDLAARTDGTRPDPLRKQRSRRVRDLGPVRGGRHPALQDVFERAAKRGTARCRDSHPRGAQRQGVRAWHHPARPRPCHDPVARATMDVTECIATTRSSGPMWSSSPPRCCWWSRAVSRVSGAPRDRPPSSKRRTMSTSISEIPRPPACSFARGEPWISTPEDLGITMPSFGLSISAGASAGSGAWAGGALGQRAKRPERGMGILRWSLLTVWVRVGRVT